MKGNPSETLKNFRENSKNENFEQYHSAEKCERGDDLGIHSVAKYQKKLRGNFWRH